MKFCGSTRASSKQRKMGRDGKGKGGRKREIEGELEIEMERGIERKRNEVVNCDRISTNGVVENTCVFFEY